MVDLIELAGLWLAAEDLAALDRTLERLCLVLQQNYSSDPEFLSRFEQLRGALSHKHRKAAFRARREGNQAAGISEISGFCGPAPGPEAVECQAHRAGLQFDLLRLNSRRSRLTEP